MVREVVRGEGWRWRSGRRWSWLEHTTVVLYSAFGRSPLLNSGGGRDHHLHRAAVLAGGGVRGGHVLGRSSDFGMAPTPTDLQTGLPSEGGVTLRPEHLFRATIDRHGLEPDAGDFDVRPLSAIYG